MEKDLVIQSKFCVHLFELAVLLLEFFEPAMTVSGTEYRNVKLRLQRLTVPKNPGVKELVGRWDNQ